MIGYYIKKFFLKFGVYALSWKNMPFGVSLEHDLELILAGWEDDQIVLDVGANIGQTAKRISSVLPSCTIYAFEPMPVTFEQLKVNSRDHPQIHPINAALGEKKGSAIMACGVTSEESRIVDDSELQDEENRVQVTVDTVDHFVAVHKFERIALLKTDCEGHDLNVLRGASSSLSSRIIDCVISEVTVNEQSFHTDFHAVDEFLRSKGYYFFAFYDYGGWGKFNSEGQFMNGVWLRRTQDAF